MSVQTFVSTKFPFLLLLVSSISTFSAQLSFAQEIKCTNFERSSSQSNSIEGNSSRGVSSALHAQCGNFSGNIDLLAFEGSFSDTAFEHGKILGTKIASGLAGHVRKTKAEFLAGKTPLERKAYEALLNCIEGNILKQTTPEFAEMHKQLELGMKAGGAPDFSQQELLSMSISSEVSIYISGLQRKLKRTPLKAVHEIANTCNPFMRGTVYHNGISLQVLQRFSKDFAGSELNSKIGCTGADASGNLVDNNTLFMARNLDTSAFMATKNTHVLAMHTGGKYKYVGAAAAGMHYSGGISGFNEKGIGVHLHQQETENSSLGRKNSTNNSTLPGNTAFFIQHKILENASSIEDAQDILKNSQFFGGWTIVVGDSKTNEIVNFEIAGNSVVMARYVKNNTLAQSNHFFHPLMQDKFYNYSFNKTLESRFRFDRVSELFEASKREHSLTQKQIGLPFFANLLADHQDKQMGWRSFGRNITKTYTALSHIMQPNEGLFTVSIGDTLPVTEGQYATFQVNWNFAESNEAPFTLVNTFKHSNNKTNAFPLWKASLNTFVQAYANWSASPKNDQDLANIIDALKVASAQAKNSGRPEFTYEYLLARLQLRKAVFAFEKNQDSPEVKLAVELFENLVKYEQFLHPYDKALSQMWHARSLQLFANTNQNQPKKAENTPEVYELLRSAKQSIDLLLENESAKPEALLEVLNSFYNSKSQQFLTWNADFVKKAKIDFVTVE